MKVHSFQLRHSFQFSDLKIQFNPVDQPVCLILGAQASGKTAILKNLFHALSWFPARAKDLRTAGIVMLDSDIKQDFVQSKLDISVQYPIEIGQIDSSAELNQLNIGLCDWQLYKTMTSQGTGHSKVQTTQLESLVTLYNQTVAQDLNFALPMIAYYPSDRFINEINLLSKNNPAVSQTHAAYELAPLPYTTFARFFEWFREISDIENARLSHLFQRIQHSPQQNSSELKEETEDSPEQDLIAKLFYLEADLQTPSLKAIKKALNCIFEDITDIYIEYSPKIQLMISYKNAEIPFTQLSNFQRQWICLIGDVVRRLCILNSQSISPCEEGEGILLIDNIDAQMDETHQHNILDKLHKAFPRLQIIASACSHEMLANEVNYQYLKLDHHKIVEIERHHLKDHYDELYEQLMNEPTLQPEITPITEQLGETESQRLYDLFKNLSDAEKQQFMQYIQDGDQTQFTSI